METKNKENNLIIFLYRGGLAWFNVFLFMRFASSAMNFSRTWTNAYKPVASHLLILAFAISFFLLFRNLSKLAITIGEDDPNFLVLVFKRIAITSIALLALLLLVQVTPEYLLSSNVQY